MGPHPSKSDENNIPPQDNGELICNAHQSKYCMYCNDCQNCICPQCVVDVHKTHDFITLSDFLNRKKKEFSSLIESVQPGPLSELENILQQIQNNETEYDRDISTCTANITNQGTQLKDIIDKITENKISDLYRKANDDKGFMEKQKEEYTQQQSELRWIFQVSKENITSSSDAELIIHVQRMKAIDLQNITAVKKPIKVPSPKFKSDKPNQNILNLEFGSLDFEELESASDSVL